MNHEKPAPIQTESETEEKKPTIFDVATNVYDSSEIEQRHEDQQNGRGINRVTHRRDIHDDQQEELRHNLIGRMKDFDAAAVYMVPGHGNVARPMRLTGRVEVNAQDSFSANQNQPVKTQLVEVIDVFGSGVNEDGVTENHGHKWVRAADLQTYEQLRFDDTASTTQRHVGESAVRAASDSFADK